MKPEPILELWMCPRCKKFSSCWIQILTSASSRPFRPLRRLCPPRHMISLPPLRPPRLTILVPWPVLGCCWFTFTPAPLPSACAWSLPPPAAPSPAPASASAANTGQDRLQKVISRSTSASGLLFWLKHHQCDYCAAPIRISICWWSCLGLLGTHFQHQELQCHRSHRP
jgi:hypothetical protein